MGLDKILLNKIFDKGISNLKPGVANEKILDVWSEYAARDGKNAFMSKDEFNQMLDENLEDGFIKQLAKRYIVDSYTPGNGLRTDLLISLFKRHVGDADLLNLSVKDALPLCKLGALWNLERPKYHEEWVMGAYKYKNMPEKYLGMEGYKLYMQEKREEFEKTIK